VIVDDATTMPALLGTGDSVLREVERAFPTVDVLVRGNHISMTGDDADVSECAAAIEELRSLLAAGVPLTPDVARESIRMLQGARSAVAAARHDGAERKPRPDSVAVLSRSILSSRGRTIRPKTEGQAEYVQQIERHTVTFGIGPAGTGKTYLAMAQAVAALQSKRVSRIILTRPAVEAGERLGFLPGTLSEKIDPYLRPLYDALHDMVDPESIPKLIEAGTIEVAPLAYMRGRTLNDAFIILDEAQNTTREQMKMFLTRLGFGSTMVVTGDITQVDLPGGTTSGLRAARDILQGIDDIGFSELGAQDVVRHRLVSDIITAYATDEAQRERPPRDGQQRRFARGVERRPTPHKETDA
jgi:phosphate starvation-inducible PhoH-like protein